VTLVLEKRFVNFMFYFSYAFTAIKIHIKRVCFHIRNFHLLIVLHIPQASVHGPLTMLCSWDRCLEVPLVFGRVNFYKYLRTFSRKRCDFTQRNYILE